MCLPSRPLRCVAVAIVRVDCGGLGQKSVRHAHHVYRVRRDHRDHRGRRDRCGRHECRDLCGLYVRDHLGGHLDEMRVHCGDLVYHNVRVHCDVLVRRGIRLHNRYRGGGP
jgi:hypothetical protein